MAWYCVPMSKHETLSAASVAHSRAQIGYALMYHFSMDGTDTVVLSTTHRPDPRRFSCGDTPRATLAELQDYSRRLTASQSDYRFLVVDLIDMFDAVLILTGDASEPVDPDQDVWMHQVTSEDYEGDNLVIPVGGFTWGAVPALVGTVTDTAFVRSTAGAVREYLADLDNHAAMGDDLTDGIALVLGAFDITAATPDSAVVYAPACDLDGVVLA